MIWDDLEWLVSPSRRNDRDGFGMTGLDQEWRDEKGPGRGHPVSHPVILGHSGTSLECWNKGDRPGMTENDMIRGAKVRNFPYLPDISTYLPIKRNFYKSDAVRAVLQLLVYFFLHQAWQKRCSLIQRLLGAIKYDTYYLLPILASLNESLWHLGSVQLYLIK